MKLNLKKYICGGCTEEIVSNEFVRECWSCGSTLLKKEELSSEDFIKFIENELESANHHDFIDLPEKIFDR